jgi:hypothetical protein
MTLGSLVNGLLGPVVLQVLVNCAARGVATGTFEKEFNCDEELQVYQLGNDTTRIEGCGHSETYHCYLGGGGVSLPVETRSYEAQPSTTWHYNLSSGHFEPSFSSFTPGPTSHVFAGGSASTVCEREKFEQVKRPVPPPPRRGPPPKVAGQVQVERRDNGDVVVGLELGLDGQSLLAFSAYPKQLTPKVQLKLLRSEVDHRADTCDLEWFATGQRLAVPAATVERRNQFLERRQLVTAAVVEALGHAENITLRSCRHRWSLKPDQVEKVRQFASAFQQQLVPTPPVPPVPVAAPPIATEPAEPAPANPN